MSTLIDRYLTMCDDTTGLGDSGCQIAVSAVFKQTWRRGGGSIVDPVSYSLYSTLSPSNHCFPTYSVSPLVYKIYKLDT